MTYQRTITKDLARQRIHGKHVFSRSLAFFLLCLTFSLLAAVPEFLGDLFFPSDFSFQALFAALIEGDALSVPLPTLPGALCKLLSLLLKVSSSGLLTVGACAYCLDLWRGHYPDVRGFFAGFDCFSSTLALSFLLTLYLLLWAVLGLIILFVFVELPTFLLTTQFPVVAVFTDTADFLSVLIFTAEVCIFCGFFLSHALPYALSFFILYDQPQFSVKRCLQESKLLLDHRIGLFLRMLGSFWNWLVPEGALIFSLLFLRDALAALFPVSVLPGAAFWFLRILLIVYLIAATVAAILLPLRLMAYIGTTVAGFYDFAQSDARNRPAPPRSWQVYH